ncbi:hypothetical protein [Falsiroseomonas oryziterrae]|uniref:hypothetical protein n=1 Tax=Falsiroseomonas oryziterrae TaxID=2911368 RepID=UPI001F2CEE0F|nr:hypothetical protein [Roseomonas sp. NPKOSM-4]
MSGQASGAPADAVTDDVSVTGEVDAAVLDGAYAGVTGAPLQAKPAKATPKGDLVVIAVHDRPSGSTMAGEMKLIADGAWSPATEDFLVVAGTGPRGSKSVPSCTNVGGFLGAIQAEPEGSLSRVVIVSHSTSGLLGFGGSIDAAGSVSITGSGGYASPLDGGVDLNAVNGLKDNAASLVEDVRKRWAEGGGEILFFSCGTGAGVNLALMQELAKLLGAKARGFSQPIGYCVQHDGKQVTARGRTTLTFKAPGQPDCATAQLGYRHLKPDRP